MSDDYKPSVCWVCGKKLGPVVGPLRNSTCAIVRDPGGTDHRVHHFCVKDADGKQIRTEQVIVGSAT